jgi:predicted ATPase/DNA-binding SARP family transcriptional activator
MRVSVGERVHTRFRTHKAAYLLAYLALHPRQPQPRERLIELFWGDKEPEAARNGLSTALAQLRRQLETDGMPSGSLLVADRSQVQLNAEITATDVADFERLLQQARQTGEPAEQIALLRQAGDLYRGELLPGCYEDWVTGVQAHYRSLFLDGMRRLIRLLESADQYAEALARAQKAMLADPYSEEICRAQMRLLVLLRQPSLALQTYERFEQLYRRDLGAMPSPTTRQMAATIREDPRAQALMRAEAAAPPPASPPSPAAPAHPPRQTPLLPLQLTRFYGRLQEQEQLKMLLGTPGVRLVTILGPGGAGKTRLAVEVGIQLAETFANRVWFVPLADIPDPSLIASALVSSLHIPPGGQEDPLERAILFLGDQPCLLILDNLEHLLGDGRAGKSDHPAHQGSMAVVRLLLARLPGLVCLTTSRQAMQMEGEHEFLLPPLALPDEKSTALTPALLDNESVALYVDRARAVRLDFAVNEQNAGAIITLCRRLEGMPLALEMAAAWAKTITPQKMLERLEHQLDLLVSRRRDLPPRHQSLRATIEWSYDLMAPELRQAFASLSVFRGGWTLEAAEAVLGWDAMHSIAALQEQSLIVALDREDETRYRMLEPLREFAREKLEERNEEMEPAKAHAAYFLEFVTAGQANYRSPEETQWLKRLEADHDNIRAALAWCQASEQRSEEKAERALKICTAVSWFWYIRGYAAEGLNRLKQALAAVPGCPASLRMSALYGIAYLSNSRGDYPEARAALEEFVTLAEQSGDSKSLLRARNGLAIMCHEDRPQARRYWEGNLELARSIQDETMVAATLNNLGELTYDIEEHEQALAYFEECVSILRRLGDQNGLAHGLTNIGRASHRLNAPDRAAAAFLESLTLRREIGDRSGCVATLEGIAGLLATQGHVTLALSLLGATESLRKALGNKRPIDEQADYDRCAEAAQSAVDAQAAAEAWNRGSAWTLEEAIQAVHDIWDGTCPLPVG